MPNNKAQYRYSPNILFGWNIEDLRKSLVDSNGIYGPRKIRKSKILNFSGITNQYKNLNVQFTNIIQEARIRNYNPCKYVSLFVSICVFS